MKWLAVLCLVVFARQASAASSEEQYWQLRDSYIRKFSSSAVNEPVSEEAFKRHEAALGELANLLRAVVGPVKVKGLPGEGTSNADTLDEHDSGFGHVDGLAFSSADYKTHVVVTTKVLLQHWLAEHRDDGLPQQIGAALKSGEFYHWVADDAAFAKYAELPIAKPAAASLAVAVLGVRSNGELKGTPNEIHLAVIQGERIYVATTHAELKMNPIPACERVWKTMMEKPADTTAPRGDIERSDNADVIYARCFAERAPRLPLFRTATTRAQSLLELLPLR